MESLYKIGELAKLAEVATSTVRYYERAGLLKPSGRTDGNYRFYNNEALERLRFIRAAKSAGFTLEDISSLIRFREGSTALCTEVQNLIENRLTELRKRLKELRHVENHLKTALEACQQAEDEGRCDVLETLSTPLKD